MCENDKSSEKCDTSSAAGEPSKYLHMSFRQEWWMVLGKTLVQNKQACNPEMRAFSKRRCIFTYYSCIQVQMLYIRKLE